MQNLKKWKLCKIPHCAVSDTEIKDEEENENLTEIKETVKSKISCLKCSVDFEVSQELIDHVESNHSNEYEYFCNEYLYGHENCQDICIGIEEFIKHLEKEHLHSRLELS